MTAQNELPDDKSQDPKLSAWQEVESPAPPGWMTIGNTKEEAGVSAETVRYFEEKMVALRPEWFKKYRSGRKRMEKHYGPEFKEFLEKKSVEKPPEGWTPLWTYGGTAKALADRYRNGHPEWFDRFRDQTGLAEHYAPELLEEIHQKLDALAGKKFSGPVSRSELETLLGYRFTDEKDSAESFSAEKASEIRDGYVDRAKRSLVSDTSRRSHAIRRAPFLSMSRGSMYASDERRDDDDSMDE